MQTRSSRTPGSSSALFVQAWRPPRYTLFPYTTLFRSVYPLDGRHDGGYYTVKDCVTIDVLPRTPGNNDTVLDGIITTRSEERVSRNAETDLVCRLLLEKKKTCVEAAQAGAAALDIERT